MIAGKEKKYKKYYSKLVICGDFCLLKEKYELLRKQKACELVRVLKIKSDNDMGVCN